MSIRRVVLVTPNFENNSLGRTWCLWLLARSLGWSVEVAGVKGRRVWAPLAGTAFAADCRPVDDPDRALRRVLHATARADLVLAVKPLPTSLGVAADAVRAGGAPLLLDVDDPDLEVRTTWRPLVERLRHPLPPARRRELARLGDLARATPAIVSNPVLQRMYGGALVPHVRQPVASPAFSATTEPVVRFVGSVRAHKGVEVLRRAVRLEAGSGSGPLALEVTADAPRRPRAGERWLGTTDVAEGARLVAGADVVAVPSLATAWSPAQLPAKLIDAMAAGRAVVASATEPVVWALGGTGTTVPPGDARALAAALHALRSPARRRELGEAAHERARSTFSVEAVAPAFESAARAAAASAVLT